MVTTDYWIYMLHCDNDSYYTGYTTDLPRRFQAHLDGKCKYTRSFKPRAIVQAWHLTGSKGQAMKIEHFIKKLSREAKQALLLSPEQLKEAFTEAVLRVVVGS